MGKQNLSSRHHFIPKCYLEGFTNSNKTFKIFDVKEKRFVANGKLFSPKSYFFIKNDNTVINSNGKEDDFIERNHLQRADNMFSKILKKVKNNSPINSYQLLARDIAELRFILAVLFWRNPSNSDRVQDLLKHNSLRELGIVIKNGDGEKIQDSELEEKLKKADVFKKSIRVLYPSLTYPLTFSNDKLIAINSFILGDLPYLCSDNPLIFRDDKLSNIYTNDFIFPLTPSDVFFQGDIRRNIRNNVKILLDLISYKQAKNYISCTDENYIKVLDALFEKNYKSIQNLKEEIFSSVFKN